MYVYFYSVCILLLTQEYGPGPQTAFLSADGFQSGPQGSVYHLPAIATLPQCPATGAFLSPLLISLFTYFISWGSSLSLINLGDRLPHPNTDWVISPQSMIEVSRYDLSPFWPHVSFE